MQRDSPILAERPPTLQDLPAIMAALAEAFGGAVVTLVSNLDKLAAAAAAAVTRVLGDADLLLDVLAEAADRGVLWVGSEEGQEILKGIDFALIGVQTAEFYGRAGIYRPLAPGLMREVLDQIDVDVDGPHDHGRLLSVVGPESENWDWICEGLLASPVLGERSVLVSDAIKCIEGCLWGPAASTLLQVIEGVISDRSGVLEDMRVGRRLDAAISGQSPVAADDFGGMVALPALEVIDREIFARREFAHIAIDDPQLNRHVILHGRTVGYRTRVNALRTLMLVVALAELFDGPIMLRATRRPKGDPTLIDDHGPLANVRQVGVARVESGLPIWRADRLLERRATLEAG